MKKFEVIYLIGLLAALNMTGCGNGSDIKNAPAQKTKSADISTEVEQFNFSFKPGIAAKYTVELNSNLSVQGGPEMTRLVVDGEMSLLTLVDNGLQISIKPVNITVKQGGVPVTGDKINNLREQLGEKVTGYFAEGVLKELYIPERSVAFSVGIWREIFSSLQISKGKKDGFTASGYDGNGQYEIKYSPLKTGNQWFRKKIDYVKGLAEDIYRNKSKFGSPEPEILASSGSLVLDKSGKVVKQITQDDTIKVALMGTSSFVSTTAININLIDFNISEANVSGIQPEKNRSLVKLPSDQPWMPILPIDAMDSQRMGNLDFKTLLKALVVKAEHNNKNMWMKKNSKPADPKEIEQNKEWIQNWSKYFSALPAFFRQQPETIKIAGKEIRHNSPATTSLLGGLSSAGTEDAQQMLLRLALDTSLGEDVRAAAARNLVQCKLPTVKTADAVKQLASEPLLYRYGIMGTGIVARKLKKNGDGVKADELVMWMLQQLDDEKDSSRKFDIFRGLANSGNPLVLQHVKPLLKSDDPQLRAGAIESIRLIDDDQVDEIIARYLDYAYEKEPLVRKAAIRTAKVRDSIIVKNAVLKVSNSDPDQKVRREATRILKN